MENTVCCENCHRTWSAEELDQIHNYWERVDPGGVVPLGQCPDPDCGALCYPSYGYVYALEQRLAAIEELLTRLLSWADDMGGWEAPVWDEARHLLVPSGTPEPNAAERDS